MTDHLASSAKEIGPLKYLNTYFAATVSHLQEVKLGKLIYITQLYHCEKYGEPFSHLAFYSFSRGPYAPDLKAVIKAQIEMHEIYFKVARSTNEPFNPCLILRAHKLDANRLPETLMNTAKKVSKDWGHKPFREILDFAARTIPYVATRFRSPIDFKTWAAYRDLTAVLSLQERIWIHDFVKAPEGEHNHLAGKGAQENVTIREIVEIYLALCGDRPDSIPARKNLGFNAHDLQHAVHDRSRRDTGQTRIEHAAHLADALMTAGSFAKSNQQVALKTGLLYLKKRGYFLMKDQLSTGSDAVNDFQSAKKWFARVSSSNQIN
jgi:hypothetical protein